MAPADPIAYYTLVATILLGVLVLTVVQLRDIARLAREGSTGIVDRALLVLLAGVALSAVAALAEMPSVVRGDTSWLTYGVVERLVSLLLGLSVGAPIVASGSAAFSRRHPTRSVGSSHEVDPDDAPTTSQPAPGWLVVLVVLLALGRRRR